MLPMRASTRRCDGGGPALPGDPRSPLTRFRVYLRQVCMAAGGLALMAGVGSAQVESNAPDTLESPAQRGAATDFLNGADRDWLRQHRVIRVGAEINYAPYEFRDVRGRFTGVVADYLELIRQRLGASADVRFEIVQLPEYDAVEEGLRKRQLDIVLALTPSRDRTAHLHFTKPYLQYVNVIVTRDSHEFVTGLADFAGRRIAVVKGHSAQQLVARAYPALQVTAYSDILDALMAVSTGREDGLVDDIFPVVHNIRQRQIGNLKLATPLEKSLQAHGFSIAVRNDWPQLVDILDRLLDTITPEEQREISQKWLSVRFDSKVDTRALWTAGAVFSTLLAAAVLWIRQLRRQRAALEAARAQAEAANRAKDAFLAGMSHELRTPLHAILGYADLLRQDRLAAGARADALTTIAGSGRHLLALINDLLDLSRIRSGHLQLRPAPVPLASLIEDVAAMIRIEAHRKGLRFDVRMTSEPPGDVVVDAKRLRQVLLNLLGNAVKFTDRGGVSLAVSGAALPGDQVRLRIEVEDTGKGVDPADRERIFAPFEQGEEGRRRESGVGLGLAISREIVQRMQGSLSVEAGSAGGSRFIVRLDLPVTSRALDADTAPHSVAGYAGRVRRILAVDDQAGNTALVEQMLRPLGFDVRTAGGAEDALAQAQGWRPDLVLMDLRMPGMSGFDCARVLRQELRAVPIVAASASAQDLTSAAADGTLFSACLRKPFQLRDLLDVLQTQLGLSWRHAERRARVSSVESAAAPEAPEALVGAPPAERLREILEYARLGKWPRIEQAALDLGRQGAQHAAFVKRLLAIAQEFDEARLARFIERHLGAGRPPAF